MIEVATGKRSFFGRPDGFGSSELKEIVDADAPDRMELVAGSDSAENTEIDQGRDRKEVIVWTSRGIWKLGIE